MAEVHEKPGPDTLEQRLATIEALLTALVARELARADSLSSGARSLLSLLEAEGKRAPARDRDRSRADQIVARALQLAEEIRV